MRGSHFTSLLLLSLSLGAAVSLPAQTNENARKQAKADAKQQHDANKAQAKADKAREKALDDGKVKDAARKQDKANAEATKSPRH